MAARHWPYLSLVLSRHKFAVVGHKLNLESVVTHTLEEMALAQGQRVEHVWLPEEDVTATGSESVLSLWVAVGSTLKESKTQLAGSRNVTIPAKLAS